MHSEDNNNKANRVTTMTTSLYDTSLKGVSIVESSRSL